VKKVKVTVANNQILHLERRWYDYWWFDGAKFMSFWLNGKRIKLAIHWILKIEDE